MKLSAQGSVKVFSSTKETKISPRVFLYDGWMGVDVGFLYGLKKTESFSSSKLKWTGFVTIMNQKKLLGFCFSWFFFVSVSLFSLQEVTLFARLFSIGGMYTGCKSSPVDPQFLE